MIRHHGIEIDRVNWRITVNGHSVVFMRRGAITFKAIETMLLAGPSGVTREQIYDATHGHREDGGTEGGPHDVHVWLCQDRLKTAFSRLGVKLVKKKDFGRMRYALRVV